MLTTTLQDTTIHTWNLGPSLFRAMPEKGARLMSWDLQLAGNAQRSILYWPENADLSQPAKIRGGNPILFPFVARTFHNKQENLWKAPSGNILPMPRHGFCRDGLFKVISLNEQGFSTRFLPDAKAKESYPFDYNFNVHYTFRELDFIVTLELENKSETSIPWCAGHHFYFTLPWHSNLKRSDYQLSLPAKRAFKQGSEGQLTPLKRPQPESTLDDPELLDRLHAQLTCNKVTFGPKGGEENITIEIGPDPHPPTYTTVTTWTENLNLSPFYCIEPWMGLPNSPEHKKGIHTVLPRESKAFTVKVSLA